MDLKALNKNPKIWNYILNVSLAKVTLMWKKSKEKRCTIQYPSAQKPLSKLSTTRILCCLTFQTLSTQLPSDSANRNLIFHVFRGADFSPFQPPRGGDTVKLRRVQSGDRGTGAHNFTCLFNNPHTTAILNFSSNCSHIYSTFTEMKQLKRSGWTSRFWMWANFIGCDHILTWNDTKHRRKN